MGLPITPARLEAVYEMLRAWPPFCRWSLPRSSEVQFHVARHNRHDALWWIDGGHHVELSMKRHGHLATVVASVAHEMVHVRQRVAKTETRGVEHNAEFKRLAKLVCTRFGFDYGQFV